MCALLRFSSALLTSVTCDPQISDISKIGDQNKQAICDNRKMCPLQRLPFSPASLIAVTCEQNRTYLECQISQWICDNFIGCPQQNATKFAIYFRLAIKFDFRPSLESGLFFPPCPPWIRVKMFLNKFAYLAWHVSEQVPAITCKALLHSLCVFEEK